MARMRTLPKLCRQGQLFGIIVHQVVTLFYNIILLICDKWLYGEYLRLIHDSTACSSQDECKCVRLHDAVVAYHHTEQTFAMLSHLANRFSGPSSQS